MLTVGIVISAATGTLVMMPAATASAESPPGWAQISAGGATCGVTLGGAAQCWGPNSATGQLGDGTTNSSGVPVPVVRLSSGVASISAGDTDACAVTDRGAAKCWGYNGYGELGDGSAASSDEPVQVVGLSSGVTSISAGTNHTCAVLTSGAAKCWGFGNNGQLGDGRATTSDVPVQVKGLTSGVASISAGNGHTCALLTDRETECWGDNGVGALGNGTTVRSNVPMRVSGLAPGVVALSSGHSDACAVTVAGAAKCWGGNTSGQLGNRSTANANRPVPVAGLTSGVASISTGDGHTCATTIAGAAKCWGPNSDGELGNGTRRESHVPVQVVGLSNGVASISSGGGHTCALRTDGIAECWGYNRDGALGDGDFTTSAVPVVVDPA